MGVIAINKTVLILGCSSDIGIQTAQKFLKKKWNVIAHFNKNKKGVDILQKKYINQIKLFKLDLSNPKSVMNFASEENNLIHGQIHYYPLQ